MSATAPTTSNAPELLRNTNPSAYQGRLPDPAELLRWGGRPGITYLYAHGANFTKYTKEGWELCRDVPMVTVEGPKGTVDLLVLCFGTPVKGADPANGVRRVYVDPDLLKETGLGSPPQTQTKKPASPQE